MAGALNQVHAHLFAPTKSNSFDLTRGRSPSAQKEANPHLHGRFENCLQWFEMFRLLAF